MSKIAKLEYNGKTYEFPVVTGTEGDTAIDIKTLRAKTGLTTIDPGYKNTGSTFSKITFLNGEKGVLMYRGYSIEELADKASFIEVIYLLIFGELPTKKQLDKFDSDIKSQNIIHEHMKGIIDAFPENAHPMGVLSTLVSALTAFNPDGVDVDSDEALYNAAVKILGKLPVMVAWTYRKKLGLPLNYADNSLDYTSNFLKMMFALPTEEYKVSKTIRNSLDKLLILHADHEQNCSTSTVRIAGSSRAGLFTSLSTGVSALWGPLHGGANQAVIEMLENIKTDGGDVDKWIDKAKDKSDSFRLMGFGHRVYKNFDPRALIIKKSADDILKKLNIDDPILDIAKKIEKIALEDEYFIKRNLYPNVDFYSGIIYRALGIPTEMFTVMFALGRLPGWVSQWIEMRKNNEPIGRPRQVYIGEKKRSFVDIKNR